ncbi:conserved membrane hypothetical protein [uncultured Paludibacter sp.]|uniref:Transport protein n=1 Tax=uncultured Paludibacter sp. TaxID=497635 RepID=A0A653AFJ2_9BACT|nr:conserved membrane hypothetical protein [uncultured Paludibacter sp.]
MTGTLVNTAAVIIGGSIGLLLNKGMPERLKTIYFQAIGLFTIAIGISMVYNMQHILIIVSALAIGSLLGEWMNLEKHTEKMSERLKYRLKIGNERFSEGLITAFLLFCIGSMTIIGSINEGLGISSDLLYTKSLMDLFSAALLASAFGVGVVFAAIPLLLFQGGITLIAMFAGEFLTQDMISGLTALGGILLIGLGINILEIKKMRIINMLPSLLVVIFLMWIFVR